MTVFFHFYAQKGILTLLEVFWATKCRNPSRRMTYMGVLKKPVDGFSRNLLWGRLVDVIIVTNVGKYVQQFRFHRG